MTQSSKEIVVIGGGAAGFFGAIHCAEQYPDVRVTILERAGEVLGKVKISGGGRCNVCHAEYDPRVLAKSYPRGGKALLGPFNRFCTGDTVAWYAARGVELKTEPDGRMFPVTDSSQTILDCLQRAAREAGVRVVPKANVERLERAGEGWRVGYGEGRSILADRVLIAPGSSGRIWEMLAGLGHTIEPPVPSLFTLNIKDPRLDGLPGLAVPTAAVSVPGTSLREEGPVLVTHWGLSGPAVLRLSAWGARALHEQDYRFQLCVHWVQMRAEEMVAELSELRKGQGRRGVHANPEFGLPSRLWKRLVEMAGIREALRWGDTSNAQLQLLAEELTRGKYNVTGKSTFKEEFVTCGGVRLDEVNFKTMESKLLPGIFFAGEILDIDAITGGYNFQAAWTTGAIAGAHLGA